MLIVVGGHSRSIGKTAVACSLIRSLPEYHWTAVKITQFGHQVCTSDGEPCECQDPKHPVAVSQERGVDPGTDSGRFLAAGAERSFWVRTPGGRLAEALPRLRRILASSRHAIIESNSLLGFVRPDLCLMVMDGAVADFKSSSLRFLDRADYLVQTSDAPLRWPEVSPALLESKPRFLAPPPDYCSAELIATVRRALPVPGEPIPAGRSI